MGGLDIFPLSFKVKNRTILILGGGTEALAKARLLRKTSAKIIAVAQKFHADFAQLDVKLVQRSFQDADLDGISLLFVAGPGAAREKAIHEQAIKEARRRRIALNVVDQPHLCDFYTPAIVDRAPVSVAISTEGTAPVLARLIRARIETALYPDLGILARVGGEIRQRVAHVLPNLLKRRRYFEALLQSPLGEAKQTSNIETVRKNALRLLTQHAAGGETGGHVSLIDAGPGAFDLLTLRALRLMQGADVIVHDDNVPLELVQMGRRDADFVCAQNSMAQRNGVHEKLAFLLAETALSDKNTVYLSNIASADPARFNALVMQLKKCGVEADIVPGVSAETWNAPDNSDLEGGAGIAALANSAKQISRPDLMA